MIRLDLNAVICGNSVDLIKEVESSSIHCILSDIPYGIGYDEWDVLHNNRNSALLGCSPSQSKMGKGFRTRGKPLNGWSEADKNISIEYEEWCDKWTFEWYRVMVSGGSCFIFAGRRYCHRVINSMEKAGFLFRDMLAWEKDNAQYKAQQISKVYERRGDIINSEKYIDWRVGNLRPLFEPILWFQKPYKIGGTISDNMIKYGVGAFNQSSFEYLDNEGLKINSNVITVKSDKSDHGLHPTQKPLKLLKFLISLVTQENQIILDPFCGSGSSLLAAKELNRNYIGFEMDEKYFEICNERLKI